MQRDLDSEDMLKLAELLRQLKSVQTEFNECKHLVGIDDDKLSF